MPGRASPQKPPRLTPAVLTSRFVWCTSRVVELSGPSMKLGFDLPYLAVDASIIFSFPNADLFEDPDHVTQRPNPFRYSRQLCTDV